MFKTMNEIQTIIEKGPYVDTWESLSKKEVPSWFKDSKFGIFIHWGLYSIPAYNNEWYSRNMYMKDSDEYRHHLETYGPHKQFGYKDFIPMFKAEQFNPEKWAEIIQSSGAKYVFPVAEHHEGFQMYRSELSHWNAYEMGPKRDILGELKAAIESRGMIFCTSTHRAEHWFFMNGGTQFESDIQTNLVKGDFYWPAMPERDPYDFESTPEPSIEFLEDWVERTVELIDRYQPKLLYFDWWIQHRAFAPYLRKIAAYYYNRSLEWSIDGMICYKHDAMMFGSGIVEVERGGFDHVKPFAWQTDTAVAHNSWCYTTNLQYKTPLDIILTLIDTVSKNGNLLLNIGPRGDGSIPEYEINLLQTIGSWLSINGEAIYHSRPYKMGLSGPTQGSSGKFSESTLQYTPNDFRFTTNHGALYAFCLNPTDCSTLSINVLKRANNVNQEGLFTNILKVTQLGYGQIDFNHTDESLILHIVPQLTSLPIVFKIEFQ